MVATAAARYGLLIIWRARRGAKVSINRSARERAFLFKVDQHDVVIDMRLLLKVTVALFGASLPGQKRGDAPTRFGGR
jgi:hypothetical protein